MGKNKRILIDIGHPAQVHHFKNVYWELEAKGWQCFFTAKKKEISIYLLEKYGLKYEKIGSSQKGMLRKGMQYFPNSLRFLQVIEKFKPDLIFSRYSPHAAHIAWLFGIPHVGFSDTESANMLDRVTVPFVDLKLTGNSYKKYLGRNHFFFNGNTELAYLHPNRFTPDRSVLKLLGVAYGEPYVIVRFVSWSAHHDLGLNGLSDAMKINAVKEFLKLARVFITSEARLPEELLPYQITVPVEAMHHVQACASLLYGESATMASECACLGVPAIYLDNVGRGYTDEEEKYGLVYNFKNTLEDQKKSIEKGLEILRVPVGERAWKERRQRFLGDKIDVTAFMVWVAENYPACVDVLKGDPDFPDTFKRNGDRGSHAPNH